VRGRCRLDGPSFEINGFVFKEVTAQGEVGGRGQDSFVRNPGTVGVQTQLRASGCTAIRREPVRDWRSGWITGHRLRVIAFTVSVTAILLAAHSLSPAGRSPRTLFEEITSWVSVLWLGALLPGSLGLIGTLLYRFPSDLDDIRPINRMICWRIVTAGKNIDIVLSTIRRCQSEMAKTPLAPYVIEVVIDECWNVALLPEEDVDVRIIVVPREYATPNNSRFKARALHYALLNSRISDTAWIVHLDEETQPTQSAIKGVCKFIYQEEASGRLPATSNPQTTRRPRQQHCRGRPRIELHFYALKCAPARSQRSTTTLSPPLS
jgi:beta-1,4-mannosyltransferase